MQHPFQTHLISFSAFCEFIFCASASGSAFAESDQSGSRDKIYDYIYIGYRSICNSGFNPCEGKKEPESVFGCDWIHLRLPDFVDSCNREVQLAE